MKTIQIVADTNLFLQCRALQDVDWKQVTNADQVVVILTRPVQVQLDRLKADGNERRAKRARAINGQLRDLYKQGPGGEILVRPEGPRVVMQAPLNVLPTPGLPDLNYDDADHRIVGIAHALANDGEMRLLTNDGGMLWTAQAVGVETLETPQEWLLPRELSETDKLRREFDQRLRDLEGQVPRFEVELIAGDGKSMKQVASNVTVHTPCQQEEIDALLAKINRKFYLKTDFSPGRSPGVLMRYRSPSTSKIKKYQSDFSQWQIEIRGKLSRHHSVLRESFEPPICCFRVVNAGVRPARNALIKITAKGNFLINHVDPSTAFNVPSLPLPPEQPTGEWVYPDDQHLWRRSEDSEFARARAEIARISEFNAPPERRADAFYFRDRPKGPVRSFELECQQWRHGSSPEDFPVGVFPENSDGDQIVGAIEFELHADNLTQPVKRIVPVRVLVHLATATASATEMVDRLLSI